MNFWQIVRNEFRQIFRRDPRRGVFLFGSSLTYLVFFALLYGTHVINSVPLVVCDEDQTQFSRSVVQAFEDSERFQVVAQVTTHEEMEHVLREKEAYAALNIPPQFTRNVKNGLGSQVLVIANGSNIAIANAVVAPAQEIVSSIAPSISSNLLARSGLPVDAALGRTAPVELRMRVLHNPTLSYQSYFLLGLALAALQAGILLSTGAGVIDRSTSFDELRSLTTAKAVAAKLLPYFLSGTLGFLLTMTVANQFFAIPFKGSPFSLLALGLVFSFSITAMSALLAVHCRTEVSYTQAILTYAVPAFILSGYIWPVEAMDPISQGLARLIPLTYTADNLRAILIAGTAPGLFQDLAATAALGTVFLLLFARRYGRLLRQTP